MLDLNGQPVSVTIPAGATSATITVPTVTDTLVEGAENVTITLSTPDNAAVTIAPNAGVATGTINDTTKLTVSISDATAVDEGQALEYTVSLTGGTSTTPITIPLTYGGSADPVLDFDGRQATVTIQPGETSATVTVSTFTDTLVEGSETLTITLVTPSNPAVTVDDGLGVGAINDTTTLTVAISDATAVDEGQSLQFTVSLTGGTATTPITIPLTYGGTADPVLDLDGQPVSVTIPGGCDQRHHYRADPD